MSNAQVSATETPTFDGSSMNYRYEFAGNYQKMPASVYADCYVLDIDDETGETALVYPTAELPAMRWAMKMTACDSQLGVATAELPAMMTIIVTGENNVTDISQVTSQDSDRAYFGIDAIRKEKMVNGINIVKMKDGKVVKIFNK